MMKRVLCLILAALMICAAAAFAAVPADFKTATTEEKLEAMIPVLDSLARSLNIVSSDAAFQLTYDPADANLVWDQLRLLSVNWMSKNAEYDGPETVKVPAEVMNKLSVASFGSVLALLPAIPAEGLEDGVGEYDAINDAYIFQKEPEPLEPTWLLVESYAADGEDLVAGCGLYRGVEEERLGGMTVRLAPMDPAYDAPMYPYIVRDAHAENAGDFDGLWVSLCRIGYTEPEPTPLPTSTPEPTTAPTSGSSSASGSGYSKLSSGSRGSDVRALQKRLNELGYDCGSVDGVFGASTKRAVRYFQDALGWKQNGTASADLQKKLFASSAPKFKPYVTLKKGSSGIRVESLQSRLRKLGYLAMPVDGDFNGRVVTAVKLFQTAAKLGSDGIAGEKTLAALEKKDAPKCDSYIELRSGDTGFRVKEMQERLKELGYYTDKPSETYDKATVKAVKAFLTDRGLDGDGKKVSAETVALMFLPAPTATPTATPEPTVTPDPTESAEPTEGPTGAPTETPTESPTEGPTEAPTEGPTEAPTESPTEAPTETPTESPTEAPTAAPTQAPEPDPAPDGGDEGGEG